MRRGIIKREGGGIRSPEHVSGELEGLNGGRDPQDSLGEMRVGAKQRVEMTLHLESGSDDVGLGIGLIVDKASHGGETCGIDRIDDLPGILGLIGSQSERIVRIVSDDQVKGPCDGSLIGIGGEVSQGVGKQLQREGGLTIKNGGIKKEGLGVGGPDLTKLSITLSDELGIGSGEEVRDDITGSQRSIGGGIQ